MNELSNNQNEVSVFEQKKENIASKDNTEKPQNLPNTNLVRNVTEKTEFSEAVDRGKINILNEAYTNDKKFQDDLKKELKEATLKAAQLEQEKQSLEKQNVKYAQELLETQQKLNQNKQAEDKWENKQKSRQFHYNGVKDIMLFVGIKEPMNIFLLYIFVIVLFIPFFASKLVKGTFGALISGGENGKDRPKEVKGFLYTLFAILCLIVVFVGCYLLVDWLHPFGWLS